MKILLITLSSAALLAASCTKEKKPILIDSRNTETESRSKLNTDSSRVQLYFHIKRVAKTHIKHLKDEYGKEYSEEIIDEITDRLYIRSIGSSKGYRIIYSLEVTSGEKILQFLVNKKTDILDNLNENIMWIDHSLTTYNDPVPQIHISRFEVIRTEDTTTKDVIYNPLLNSYELVRLAY